MRSRDPQLSRDTLKNATASRGVPIAVSALIDFVVVILFAFIGVKNHGYSLDHVFEAARPFVYGLALFLCLFSRPVSVLKTCGFRACVLGVELLSSAISYGRWPPVRLRRLALLLSLSAPWACYFSPGGRSQLWCLN